jgi:hypothetical protein
MPEAGGPAIHQGLREAPRVTGQVPPQQRLAENVREVMPEMNYDMYQAYCAQLIGASNDRDVSNSALISMLSNWEPRFDGRYLSPTLRTIRNIDPDRTESFENPDMKVAVEHSDNLRNFKIDWINHHAEDLRDIYRVSKDPQLKMDIGGVFADQLSEFRGIDFDPRVRPTIEFFIENFDTFKDSMDPLLIRDFFRNGIIAGNRGELDADDKNVERISREVLELAIRAIDDPDSSKPLRDGAYEGLAVGQRELDDEMLSDTIENYLTRRLKLLGVNRKIMNAWDFNYITEDIAHRYPEFLADNFDIMQRLELERPGICNVLYEEFGINNFARYPLRALVDQYDNRDKDIPYGVLVYPHADANGAFSQDTFTLDELHDDLLGAKVGLRIYEAGSGFGLLRRFSAANKRYGNKNKISFAIIGGHGSADGILLGNSRRDDGEEINSHRISKDNLQYPAVEVLKQWFITNPNIILISCSTGAEAGIGEGIHKIGANVIAPKEPTSLERIVAGKRSNGSLWFGVKYSDDDAYKHFRQKLPK